MSSKIVNLNKLSMHRRPTYETLAKDSILEPKDRIALPDRLATQLRNTQQLSMWDDPAFLNLEDEQQKIMQNQIRQGELLKISQTPLGKGLPASTPPQQISSMKVQKALSEGSKPKDTTSSGSISKITPGAASSSNKPVETFIISDTEDHLLEKQRDLEEDLETERLLTEEKKQKAIKQAEETLKTKTIVDEYIEDLYKAVEDQTKTTKKTKEEQKQKTKKPVIGQIGTAPYPPIISASAAAQEDTPEITRSLPAGGKIKKSVGRPSKEQISPELSRPRSASRTPQLSAEAAAMMSGEEAKPPHRLEAVMSDIKYAKQRGKLSKEDIDYYNLLLNSPQRSNPNLFNKEMKSFWTKIYTSK